MQDWKQCKTRFPGTESDDIVEVSDKLFMAEGCPAEMALFERRPSSEPESTIFSFVSGGIPVHGSGGTWQNCPKPDEFIWSLVLGNGDPHKLLGLPKPVASEREVERLRKGVK